MVMKSICPKLSVLQYHFLCSQYDSGLYQQKNVLMCVNLVFRCPDGHFSAVKSPTTDSSINILYKSAVHYFVVILPTILPQPVHDFC
jgi:hypothetical protein